MKKTVIIVCLMLIAGFWVVDVTAQRNSNIGYYTIEPECLGSELDGSVTLRSWGTGRNRFDAVDQAKKNAVRDVIFKGIRKGSSECNPRPLLPEVNAEMKYEDFFNRFSPTKGAITKNSAPERMNGWIIKFSAVAWATQDGDLQRDCTRTPRRTQGLPRRRICITRAGRNQPAFHRNTQRGKN